MILFVLMALDKIPHSWGNYEKAMGIEFCIEVAVAAIVYGVYKAKSPC